MGAKNALKILSMIGKADVPVYVGEETPLVRDYVDAMDTHGTVSYTHLDVYKRQTYT